MTPKSWEEALTDAYWEYRWHKILDPLCDTFQRWKDGELSYQEVDAAIDKAYHEKNLVNSLLTYRPDRAAAVIQWWDRDWFLAWIKENRPPSDVEIEEPPPETSS